MKQYTFIKPDYTLQNNLMAFAPECDNGWDDILEELCDKIQKLVDSEPERYKDFEFTQVKEKFGSLRVYCNYEDDEINKLIDEACAKSERTCEICGNPGRITYRGTWMKTLCKKCEKERKQNG